MHITEIKEKLSELFLSHNWHLLNFFLNQLEFSILIDYLIEEKKNGFVSTPRFKECLNVLLLYHRMMYLKR